MTTMKHKLKPSIIQLDKENRMIIKKIVLYMESHNVSEAACLKITEDLIGMALECQKRGEPFSSVIGENHESFCRELTENAPRQSVVERTLQPLRLLIISTGLLVPAIYAIAFFFSSSPANCENIHVLASPFFFLKYLLVTVAFIIMWLCTERGVYKSKRLIAFIFAGIISSTYMICDLLENLIDYVPKMSINLLIWIGIFIILTVCCEIVLKISEAKQARKIN